MGDLFEGKLCCNRDCDDDEQVDGDVIKRCEKTIPCDKCEFRKECLKIYKNYDLDENADKLINTKEENNKNNINTKSVKYKIECKLLIFTVSDSENLSKPIIYCCTADKDVINEQDKCEDLIAKFLNDIDFKINIERHDSEDIAYGIRKNGYYWFDSRYCFELTECDAGM